MVRCNKCNDTGWIQTDKGVIRCDCVIERAKEEIWRVMRIPRKYIDAEIWSFSLYGFKERIGIQRRVEEYIESNDLERGMGLYIYGDYGSGKTYLAVSILKEIYRKKGIIGLFYDVGSLLYDLRDSYSGNGSLSSKILNKIKKTKLLVLDDLGSERPSDWAKDIIQYIIFSRYNEKLPTIITSNTPIKHTEKHTESTETIETRFGKAVSTRIIETTYLVEMPQTNIREHLNPDKISKVVETPKIDTPVVEIDKKKKKKKS